MGMISTSAIILRASPYRESDTLLTLFTLEEGKLSLIARGARRSKRRYMGTLELGARLKLSYRSTPKLGTLGPCDILSAPWRARRTLTRFTQLCYLLELLNRGTPEGEADPALFESACAYLDHLESAAEPTEEGLIRWELALMSHLGYALRIDRCPYTGAIPDAISYRAGGSFSSHSGRRGFPLKTELLRQLYRLQRGQEVSSISGEDATELRAAMLSLWSEIIGTPLKSAPFFSLSREATQALPREPMRGLNEAPL